MTPSPFTGSAQSELFEGGYYSIADGERFSIAKVLKLDEDIVHVRIYKEHFQQRPRSIDVSLLTLGKIGDKDGFGMSHLPLRLQSFKRREPVFLAYSEVKPTELKGYELWKDLGAAGVFE